MWISSQSHNARNGILCKTNLRGSKFQQLNCSATLVNFRNEESCCLHAQPMWKIGRALVQKAFP